MFNLGFSEILVISLVALLILGPERIPKASLWLGKIFREIRGMSRSIQESLEDAVTQQEIDQIHSNTTPTESSKNTTPRS